MTELEFLTSVLNAYHVPVTIDRRWLESEGGFPRWTARLEKTHEEEAGVVVRLDVFVALASGECVCVSHGAHGEAVDAAARRAFAKFVQTALLPIRDALSQDRDSTDTQYVEKESADATWGLYVGGARVEGVEHEAQIPQGFGTAVIDKATGAFDARRFHFASVFYAASRGKDAGGEFIVDGEPQHQLAEQIAALDWDRDREFFSIKLCLAAVPQDDSPQAREVTRDHYGLDEWALFAGELIEQIPRIPDPALTELLEAHGLDIGKAEELVSFLPIAYGRLMLRECRFTSMWERRTLDGETVGTFSLSDEPAYVHGTALALEHLEQKTKLPGYEAFALRSAEVRAASAAMKRGQTLDGAEFSDLSLILEHEGGWRNDVGVH